MRRIISYLAFSIVLLLIFNCENQPDDASEEGTDIVVGRELDIIFEMEFEVNGIEAFRNQDSEEPIVIFENDVVIYRDFSSKVTRFAQSDTRRDSYDGPLMWQFDGGDPMESDQSILPVVYRSEGKYDVKLSLDGIDNFPAKELTLPEFVCVLSRPVTDFGAETDGAGGTEITGSDGSVKIEEGESVTFVNTTANGENFSPNWIFMGGTPSYASNNTVVVTYNTPGKYPVILWNTLEELDLSEQEIEDLLADPSFIENEAFGIRVDDYVCVEAKPECRLEVEESSDDRRTEFMYSDQILALANKYLSGQLQEVSTYVFDDLNRLEQEQFFNAVNELLGIRALFYNVDNQLTSVRTETADGTLLREDVFTYDSNTDRIPANATYNISDGLGGFNLFEVEYVHDAEEENITLEIFRNGGDVTGRNIYVFDGPIPKPTAELFIDASPLIFNNHAPTSIVAQDAAGNILAEQSSTFQQNTEENCGPLQEERTANGVTTTFTYTFSEQN